MDVTKGIGLLIGVMRIKRVCTEVDCQADLDEEGCQHENHGQEVPGCPFCERAGIEDSYLILVSPEHGLSFCPVHGIFRRHLGGSWKIVEPFMPVKEMEGPQYWDNLSQAEKSKKEHDEEWSHVAYGDEERVVWMSARSHRILHTSGSWSELKEREEHPLDAFYRDAFDVLMGPLGGMEVHRPGGQWMMLDMFAMMLNTTPEIVSAREEKWASDLGFTLTERPDGQEVSKYRRALKLKEDRREQLIEMGADPNGWASPEIHIVENPIR